MNAAIRVDEADLFVELPPRRHQPAALILIRGGREPLGRDEPGPEQTRGTWKRVGETDDGPIWRDPWQDWLLHHEREAARYAGRCVALHPEFGILGAEDNVDALVERLRDRLRTLPFVSPEDVTLMRLPSTPGN